MRYTDADGSNLQGLRRISREGREMGEDGGRERVRGWQGGRGKHLWIRRCENGSNSRLP